MPTVILSWIGAQPELPSILLNSHMDVVPVFEEFWKHKPFSADIDEEGKIFARGSQDMKCVGMQYLGAIRQLKRNNRQLKRSLHIVFVPEEEVFGPEGMKAFVKTDYFKNLKVGFTLDEGGMTLNASNDCLLIQPSLLLGIASPTDVFNVFYGERTCWRK